MKRVALALVLVLLLSLPAVTVGATAGQAYSSIQVINLGGGDAHIAIFYYNQDGSLDPASPANDTIPKGESATYFPVHAADGFNGSVVIESTEPIAVVSNILYTAPDLAQATYVGFPEGASQIVFPILMKGNNTNDTSFNVQNTTGEKIDITIEFVPEPNKGYAAIPNVKIDVQPWSARTFDQRTMGEFSAVTKWVGSARVTVDADTLEDDGCCVAGTAQIFYNALDAVAAYDAFLEEGNETASIDRSTVRLPIIMDNNNNMWTGINCQNLGGTTTTMEIAYTPEAGYPAKTDPDVAGVVANGNAVWLQDPWGTKWVGAAEVTNTAGNPIACIVNQANLTSRYYSSYEGVYSSESTASAVGPLSSVEVAVPVAQYQPQASNDILTALNVANLGDSEVDVTIDWKPGPGFTDLADSALTIGAGSVGVKFLIDPYNNGQKWIGGAVVSVDDAEAGDEIAVVVNQQRMLYDGDYYSSYVGMAIFNGAP